VTEQSEHPFFAFRQRMSKQLGTPEAMLASFAAGPEDLERSLAGLSEPALNLARGPDKWTIRQTVHHIVDGDHMWGMCARVAMGSSGSTYRLDWYRQDLWVDVLDHARRPIAPALGLLRANRCHLVQLLEHLSNAWKRYVLIPRPECSEGFKMVVRDIILTQAVHIPWHIAQIRETRQMHGA
jgi:hypothetical protein